MEEPERLDERVKQFKMMKLPGQPLATHMGTSYLVNDLDRERGHFQKECERLREERDRERQRVDRLEELLKRAAQFAEQNPDAEGENEVNNPIIYDGRWLAARIQDVLEGKK